MSFRRENGQPNIPAAGAAYARSYGVTSTCGNPGSAQASLRPGRCHTYAEPCPRGRSGNIADDNGTALCGWFVGGDHITPSDLVNHQGNAGYKTTVPKEEGTDSDAEAEFADELGGFKARLVVVENDLKDAEDRLDETRLELSKVTGERDFANTLLKIHQVGKRIEVTKEAPPPVNNISPDLFQKVMAQNARMKVQLRECMRGLGGVNNFLSIQELRDTITQQKDRIASLSKNRTEYQTENFDLLDKVSLLEHRLKTSTCVNRQLLYASENVGTLLTKVLDSPGNASILLERANLFRDNLLLQEEVNQLKYELGVLKKPSRCIVAEIKEANEKIANLESQILSTETELRTLKLLHRLTGVRAHPQLGVKKVDLITTGDIENNLSPAVTKMDNLPPSEACYVPVTMTPVTELDPASLAEVLRILEQNKARIKRNTTETLTTVTAATSNTVEPVPKKKTRGKQNPKLAFPQVPLFTETFPKEKNACATPPVSSDESDNTNSMTTTI